MATLEQKRRTNYELFFSTVKALSASQDFYGRLFKRLIDMNEDERIELINKLPEFKDIHDVIFWIGQ